MIHDIVKGFGKPRFLGSPQMLGDVSQATPEAINACADGGGLRAYDTLPGDPNHWQAVCQNGKSCTGGAETPTECKCPVATGTAGPPGVAATTSQPRTVCTWDHTYDGDGAIAQACNTTFDPTACWFAVATGTHFLGRGQPGDVARWKAWYAGSGGAGGGGPTGGSGGGAGAGGGAGGKAGAGKGGAQAGTAATTAPATNYTPYYIAAGVAAVALGVGGAVVLSRKKK